LECVLMVRARCQRCAHLDAGVPDLSC
jgi:hypothetical protein